MVLDKVRIRFRKSGDLRLISHHDLMRCFERMLRRAALPFHSTAGFNPKPRLVFAMPLPLGVIGHQEIVELELDEVVPPEVVQHKLSQQAPPGLEILGADRIPPKTTAHVHRVTYCLPLPARPDFGSLDLRGPDDSASPDFRSLKSLDQRIHALLACPHCFVERTRPQPRRLDIRPYIDDLRWRADALEMDILVTPNGSARPDELVEILGLRRLLEEGAVLERTRLDLEEETPVASGVALAPRALPVETKGNA